MRGPFANRRRRAYNRSVLPTCANPKTDFGIEERKPLLIVTRTATFTPEEWEAYERAKMAEQDARGALAVAHQEGHAEGHKSGLAEGETAGKAAAILAFLAARGISVGAEARARIEACKDGAILDAWIVRAATAASAEEVIAAPARQRIDET